MSYYVVTDNAIYGCTYGRKPKSMYLGSSLVQSPKCAGSATIDPVATWEDGTPIFDSSNVVIKDKTYTDEELDVSPDDYRYWFDDPTEVVCDFFHDCELLCQEELDEMYDCEGSWRSADHIIAGYFDTLLDADVDEKGAVCGLRKADLSKFFKRFYAFIESECCSVKNDKIEFNNKRLKFFTMSFPQGVTDKHALEIWNLFNTVVKQNGKRFDFIRVCERQQNGTIHFHFVTAQYIGLRMMCEKISRWLDKRGYHCPNYNGLDLSKTVLNDKRYKSIAAAKMLVDYLAKYLTKSHDAQFVQPVSYSRGVSSLFTGVVVDWKDQCFADLSDMLREKHETEDLSIKTDAYVIGYRFPQYRRFFRSTWFWKHLYYLNRIVLRSRVRTLDELKTILSKRGRLDILNRLALSR